MTEQRIMYVCSECADNFPEACGHFDRNDLRVMPDGKSGSVVLSGYPSPMYDAALPEWHRIEREALADGARPRTEVLWINPRAVAAQAQQRLL